MIEQLSAPLRVHNFKEHASDRWASEPKLRTPALSPVGWNL
jgi:hypothetical protein